MTTRSFSQHHRRRQHCHRCQRLSNTIGSNNTANGSLRSITTQARQRNTATGLCAHLERHWRQQHGHRFQALVDNTTGAARTRPSVGPRSVTIQSAVVTSRCVSAGHFTTGNSNIDIGNGGRWGVQNDPHRVRNQPIGTHLSRHQWRTGSNRYTSYRRRQRSSRHDHILCAFQGRDQANGQMSEAIRA